MLRAVRVSAQTTCVQVVTDGLMRSIPRHLRMLDVRRAEVERLVVQVAADARGLCLNLCGGGAAFLPSTVLARLGRTWRV